MSKRILVTGSKRWADTATIEAALREVLDEWDHPTDAVLVKGECPSGAGATVIARHYWESLDLPVEKVPANWGGGGEVAEYVRNEIMVQRGADICLVFADTGSRTAYHCAGVAARAGIPVRFFDPAPDAGE